MLRQYYTLLKITESMKSLVGFSITEIFTQDKSSLIFKLENNIISNYIYFCADNKISYIYLKDSFSRARKNTLDLFPKLSDQKIINISVLKNDRIIKILTAKYHLYFILFGGNKSNFIYTDRNNEIIGALKYRKELKGTVYSASQDNKQKFFEFDSDIKIYKALASSDKLLGSHYAKEICIQSGIDINTTIGQLATNEIGKIEKKSIEILNEIRYSDEYYLSDNNGKLILSLIPLSELDIIRSFDDINDAVLNRVINQYKSDSLNSVKKSMITKLEGRIKKFKINIANILDDSKARERISDYRLYGEILMSQADLKQKTGNLLKTLDYAGEEMSIPLDTKLNLIENADKYYKKAKNTEEELKIRKKMLPEMKTKLHKLEELYNTIINLEDVNELKKLETSLSKIAGIKMHNEAITPDEKYRTFDLGEGFTLYVGKNAANNDELTMRFAKANDIWLHARGSGGSHCVIRIDKGQKPNKHIIKKAAEIAAYYSQARNAKYTPVAYTFKKYVRKPKGANPGSVVIAREEVIMAEPKLPD